MRNHGRGPELPGRDLTVGDHLTIGRGHTSAAGPPVATEGLSLTQAEADALFAADLKPYVTAVRAALAKPVPQPFFDACCSLCFNIGAPNFAHSSVVRLANAGDLARAVDAVLMWDRPATILTRRQGERDQAALIAYGAVYARRGDPAPVQPPSGPAPVVAERPGPLAPITGTPAATAEPWWLRLRDTIRHNMQKGA